MSVLPFLAVAIVGAVIATLLRDIRRLGTLAGLGAVVVALAAACFINPDTPLSIGGGALAGSDHLRLVLTLCLAGGLLVLVVARLATWQPSTPGALLGGAAGIGLALGLAGTPPGLLGAAAATIAASVLALGSPAAPSRIRALARELRGAATSLVIGLSAAGIMPGAAPAPGAVPAEPAAAALVLLGMALIVAHRFGAIPLHARVSRLADAAPSGALPILAAWLPAAWGLIILGWAPAALGPSSAGLGLERGLIVTLALATLLLGTVAALIQDEVEHVVAYTIVADAGVALLALAALGAGPRRRARRGPPGRGRLAGPAGMGRAARHPAVRHGRAGAPPGLRRIAGYGGGDLSPAGGRRRPPVPDRGRLARRASPPPGAASGRGRRPRDRRGSSGGRDREGGRARAPAPRGSRGGRPGRASHAGAQPSPASGLCRDPARGVGSPHGSRRVRDRRGGAGARADAPLAVPVRRRLISPRGRAPSDRSRGHTPASPRGTRHRARPPRSQVHRKRGSGSEQPRERSRHGWCPGQPPTAVSRRPSSGQRRSRSGPRPPSRRAGST